MPDLKIKIPRSVFLEQDSESWENLLKDLTFPVIVKPRVSSIVSHSHDLFIVRDSEVLLMVIELNPYLKEDSIIVQEYIMNHSEQLIKIYAVGKTFDPIFKRTFPVSAVIHYLNEQGFLKIG
jgi:glutathione synthase/RimK-type ligase-like ATP-grasp enzyme